MDKYVIFDKLTDLLSEYVNADGTVWIKDYERPDNVLDDDELVNKYGLSVSDELIRYESQFDKLATRLLAISEIIDTIRENY